MALEITYWEGLGVGQVPVVGGEITSESLSLTATSAQSAATPSNAVFISICATEAARFAYGADPTAGAAGSYLASGERMWIKAKGGFKVAGRTA